MAKPPRIETSLVSVDVLALRFDQVTGTVLLGIAPRAHDPFAGALALPGAVEGGR